MRILDAEMMKHLSFPDCLVEKMELSHGKKHLVVMVDGAWLDLSGGQALGRGVLYFSDWSELMVRAWDHTTETWSTLEGESIEILRELCEAKFDDKTACLRGFGERSGRWIEWKMDAVMVRSEFS